MRHFQAVFLFCGCILVYATEEKAADIPRCNVDDNTSWQCSTKACKHQVIVDQTMKPCNNFYKYVCSSVQDSNDATVEDFLKRKSLEKLKRILEGNSRELADDHDTTDSIDEEAQMSIITLAKKVYRSCLQDADQNSKREMKQILLKILKDQGIDTWPVTRSPPRKYSEILANTGLRPVSSLRVVPEEERKSFLLTMNIPHHRFALYPHVMKDIEKEKHSDKKKKYQQFICSVLLFFEHKKPSSRQDEERRSRRTSDCGKNDALASVIADILDVEKNLARIADDATRKRRHGTQSIMQWESVLPETFPLMSGLARDFNRAQIAIGSHDEVRINNIDYFEHLAAYLLQLDTKKFLNYIGWHIARSVADVLTKTIRKRLNEFLGTIPKPRVAVDFDANVCIDKLIGHHAIMEKGIAYLYLKENFNKAAVKKASSISPFLRTSFKYFILNNKWMDPISREIASKWNDAVIHLIGAPLLLLNESYIDSQYNLVVHHKGEHFLWYVFSLRENQYLQNLRENKQQYSRGAVWPDSSLEVRGRYSEHYIALEIPAVALQEPIFAYDDPTSEIFGSMVTFTAETLAFGLLDEGRVWNERDGKYKWKNKAIRKFKQAINCLKRRPKKDQKKEEEDASAELSVDSGSSVTLAIKAYEHIALRTTFMAFKQLFSACNGKCTEFENDEKSVQAFFTAYAKRHCVSDKSKQEEHSVNFQLKTYEEFWNAFHCQDTDPMREKDECKIVT